MAVFTGSISGSDFRLGFDTRVRTNVQSLLGCSLIVTALASGLATPLSAEPAEATVGLAVASDPSFGQREGLGFGGAYQTWLELSGGQGLTDYALRVSLAEADADARVSLDGSHVSLGGGPWSVSLGAKERNWSFSPNTSLIWSQNAPPVPALSFERASGRGGGGVFTHVVYTHEFPPTSYHACMALWLYMFLCLIHMSK